MEQVPVIYQPVYYPQATYQPVYYPQGTYQPQFFVQLAGAVIALYVVGIMVSEAGRSVTGWLK